MIHAQYYYSNKCNFAAEKPPESMPAGTNKGYVMKLPKEGMRYKYKFLSFLTL